MVNSLNGWNQLEMHVKEIVAAAQEMEKCGKGCLNARVESSTAPTLVLENNSEVQLARRKVIASVERIQNAVSEPTNFIHRLAHHTQLLACLQWLGEFSVLACIPLTGEVITREVADLAGVPEAQLTRIVRMTATAGFLNEPQPGYIAHTRLSAAFVYDLSYLDAAMLLAETAAPAALHMTATTHRYIDKQLNHPEMSAYNLAFNTTQSFQSACEQRPRLQRQWLAYLRCTGVEDDGIAELLNGLGWSSLGSARIVDIGAHSLATAKALARLSPTLHFIVQLASTGSTKDASLENPSAQDLTGADELSQDLNRRIVVQHRAPASPQTVKDAAVYILNLRSLSDAVWGDLLRSRTLAELRTHAEILRENASATLILLPDVLSDSPRTDDKDIKSSAYLRDLSLWQMTNGWGMDLMGLIELVNCVVEDTGRLVVSDKLRLPNGATVGLCVKYQSKWKF